MELQDLEFPCWVLVLLWSSKVVLNLPKQFLILLCSPTLKLFSLLLRNCKYVTPVKGSFDSQRSHEPQVENQWSRGIMHSLNNIFLCDWIGYCWEEWLEWVPSKGLGEFHNKYSTIISQRINFCWGNLMAEYMVCHQEIWFIPLHHIPFPFAPSKKKFHKSRLLLSVQGPMGGDF